MKNMTIAAIAAVTALVTTVTGCKTVPTAEDMYAYSQSVGYTSGLIANETKIDDSSRAAIIDIVTKVAEVVPETNQTFQAAWTPIAQKYVDELVTAGKLSEAQGLLVLGGVKVATMGLDYVFTVYPKAKDYKEIVAAAVDGFSNGFLLAFKPTDGTKESVEIKTDAKAYKYIKSNM